MKDRLNKLIDELTFVAALNKQTISTEKLNEIATSILSYEIQNDREVLYLSQVCSVFKGARSHKGSSLSGERPLTSDLLRSCECK